MNGDTGKGFLPNVWPILMVVLLAAGVVVNKEPLESARPTDPERAKVVPSTEQDVDARLWQDPFAAIEKHEAGDNVPSVAASGATADNSSAKHTPNAVRERIKSLVEKSHAVTILAVSVFVDPYVESAEFRRRSRYAVLSALGSRGYHPEKQAAIGYFRVKLPKSGSVESPECIPRDPFDLTVPYEWFTKEVGSKILVLWLNEDKISDSPEEKLDCLLKRLNPYPRDDRVNAKLVGPTGSTMLGNLIGARRDPAVPASRSDFEAFSPGSTVPTLDLSAGREIASCASDICKDEKLNLPELSIVRTTGTDDELAKALLWELEQRGVNRPWWWTKLKVHFRRLMAYFTRSDSAESRTAGCDDGLVLVHEWDTKYGRILSDYLSQGFATKHCGAQKPDIAKCVRRFTYLRGLDGALPDLDNERNAKKGKDETGKAKALREQLQDAPPEHAEGRNQYDYLRRLGDEIGRLDADGTFAKNGVKAIGIVGSDVYDKLLILQALRPRFKDKIFFTTDLDARYLHADQKKWARNLVVASNFDLALHPALQKSTPAFRDTYQTATYLATLMALESSRDKASKIDWSNERRKWLRPQLFEIGRTTAVHLASPEPAKFDEWLAGGNPTVYTYKKVIRCDDNLRHCESVEPIRQLRLPALGRVFALGVVLVFGFCLIALTSSRFLAWRRKVQEELGSPRRDVSLAAWSRTRIMGTLIVALLASLVIIYGMLQKSLAEGVGEPFLWFEGVSVWPGLVLRFIGLVITIALAWYFWIRSERQAKDIAECFGLDMPKGHRRLERRWWQAMFEGPHLDLAAFDAQGKPIPKSSPAPVDLLTLWQNYLRATGWREMIWWIGMSYVLVIPVALSAFVVLGFPSFPGRGELVANLHYLLLVPSVLLLWGTIFWGSYQTRACGRFIEILSRMRGEQLERLLECEEAARADVPSTCLAAYLAFRLTVRATARIQGLIYLPFILILFMVMGRSDLFDAMDFPLPIVFVAGFALAYAFYTAVWLRSRAEAVRKRLLAHYETLLMKPAGSEDSLLAVSSDQIDRLMKRIRGTSEGAFARFSEQPALQALLLPFGGYGSVQLIQYVLANWNL